MSSAFTPTLPDLRRRHRHDLAAVRRVREHFLVAAHRRGEDGFTRGRAARAERGAAKDRAVGEDEVRRLAHR